MEDSISLRFKQGSSDKVYNLSLERLEKDPDNAGWVVNFAYGRYGKALKHGTKTGKPISFERAQKLYNKVVTEKTAKGYTPDGDGTPFTAPQITQERTNLFPQLLNEITWADLPQVLEDFGGTLALQTKHDGERRCVSTEDSIITGSNRRALKCGMHPRVVLALQDLSKDMYSDFILDCEDMGASLVAFDVLKFGELDLRPHPFWYRTQFLKAINGSLIDMCLNDVVICDIPQIHTNMDSLELAIDYAEAQGEEGVVLRDMRAPYKPGRPNSGGSCLKLKFWQSATCVVLSNHSTKRSIELGLYYDVGRFIQSMGNCTVPTNYPIPCKGDLVEIKYLYAYRGGSIYQPQYKGIRSDLLHDAAMITQLKYRKET